MTPEQIAEGRETIERASALPWYTLDPPWLPPGTETSILSGSPDPCVATFVAEMDLWALDDDDDRKSNSPDADAALIVAAVNDYPAYLDLCERVGRLREALRWVSTMQVAFDANPIGVIETIRQVARAALSETPHDQG